MAQHLINTTPPRLIKDAKAAEEAFLAELRQSTKWYPAVNVAIEAGFLTIGRETATVDFYLTYLSPQLLAAAIHQEAVRRSYNAMEEERLLFEANERLVSQSSMAFVLYMKSDNPNAAVHLEPFGSKAQLLAFDGTAVSPSRYEPLFDSALDMRPGIRWGYILFPLCGCTSGQLVDVVNLDQQPSLSVQIVGVGFSYPGYPPESFTNLSWNYNLVPIELPLEQALKIPERGAAPVEGNLTLQDWAAITDIVGTIITVVLRMLVI